MPLDQIDVAALARESERSKGTSKLSRAEIEATIYPVLTIELA
jgi:hypothetical protein